MLSNRRRLTTICAFFGTLAFAAAGCSSAVPSANRSFSAGTTVLVGSQDTITAVTPNGNPTTTYSVQGAPLVITQWPRHPGFVIVLIGGFSASGTPSGVNSLATLNLRTGTVRVIGHQMSANPRDLVVDDAGVYGDVISDSQLGTPPVGSSEIGKFNLQTGALVGSVSVQDQLGGVQITSGGTSLLATSQVRNVGYDISIAPLAVDSTLTFGTNPRAFNRGVADSTIAGDGNVFLVIPGYNYGGPNILNGVKDGAVVSSFPIQSIQMPAGLISAPGWDNIYIADGENSLHRLDLTTETLGGVSGFGGLGVEASTIAPSGLVAFVVLGSPDEQQLCQLGQDATSVSDCHPLHIGSSFMGMAAVLS